MKLFSALLLVLWTMGAFAQGGAYAQRVSFQYKNTRLKSALNDLTRRYDLRFSYSSDQIDLRQRISSAVSEVPLRDALRQMLHFTGIGFQFVGNHIVLRPDPTNVRLNEQQQTSSPKELPGDPLPEGESPQTDPPDTTGSREQLTVFTELPMVSKAQGPLFPMDGLSLQLEQWRREFEWSINPEDNRSLFQISILPYLGTNGRRGEEIINKVSMNLLWGLNGGVEGVEAGSFFNQVRGHVRGLQVAGLGNVVEGPLDGSQIAGLFNFTQGHARGFQFALVGNFAGSAQATQFAGLANWTQTNSGPLQVAGAFNRAGGHSGGVQLAGLGNHTSGSAQWQVAALYNRAGEVEKGQISALVNKAGRVEGFQLAPINLADTVSGISIGLLNIVRRGYNKFDLYAGEGLHFNAQLKLGARRFYNTFYTGARYPDGDGTYTWAFGYGLGAVFAVGRKAELNAELMAIHLNESEALTKKLHDLCQLRFSWNHRLGKYIGVFFGPTLNVLLSKRTDPESGVTGQSAVVPYTWVNTTLNAQTALKAWAGLNAGFRF